MVRGEFSPIGSPPEIGMIDDDGYDLDDYNDHDQCDECDDYDDYADDSMIDNVIRILDIKVKSVATFFILIES